ncbi:MAG: glycine dehydrogenase (aminomethyl-transferring) [Magnetococcales bacterium]|nr:glycine dehydrogenase (aminomethyl-transferring) [Magnetococcales bacterium]HIJ82786.1 aminomethyl-transferring glycine dehydrogenase subunit GcvPB [Magnetococcales bacterium]
MSDIKRQKAVRPVIFAESRKQRPGAVKGGDFQDTGIIPERFLRTEAPLLPEVSELQTVRHFTRLSQHNFSVDTHFYPLGSCTMKYNPRACHTLAMLPEFLQRHPLSPDAHGQGVLQCLFELGEYLKEITGTAGVSLTPMAGAQGEFAGVAMIRAYHEDRGDHDRTEMLVPDAAHGTNPATAAMCGLTVREIPTDANGDIDLSALKQALGPRTAGLMLTNPSTLGVFERRVRDISNLVHAAGGLLYYDGANLNAITGRVRPGDMGFDAIHVNVHKTFATPHGGGGPGAGPVGVSARLVPYLPVPMVVRNAGGDGYRWLNRDEAPRSIGRLSAFAGNIGILLRAYVYVRLLGQVGMRRVADYSTLNANYLKARLQKSGFQIAYPDRRATHEFIVSLKGESERWGVSALDFAKRLLDYGFYAPTIYFPMLVPECLLIEPTETETKEELDRFADALAAIRREAETDPELVKGAPHHIPVPGGGLGRLDDTRAARKPDLIWRRTLEHE